MTKRQELQCIHCTTSLPATKLIHTGRHTHIQDKHNEDIGTHHNSYSAKQTSQRLHHTTQLTIPAWHSIR